MVKNWVIKYIYYSIYLVLEFLIGNRKINSKLMQDLFTSKFLVKYPQESTTVKPLRESLVQFVRFDN